MKITRRGRLTRPEGYLMVDHRAGAGLPLDFTQRMGLPPLLGGSVMESATVTCSHCQRMVVLNPDRSRPRAYCPKCDHYVCDECEAARGASGGACNPFAKVIDDVLEAGEKGVDPALVIPISLGGKQTSV